jgi:hypothetical protein
MEKQRGEREEERERERIHGEIDRDRETDSERDRERQTEKQRETDFVLSPSASMRSWVCCTSLLIEASFCEGGRE